jgi:hypothetical protein
LDGTTNVIRESLQLVASATIPAMVTVLLPWVEPNPLPLTVMDVLVIPDSCDMAVILGAAKRKPLARTIKARTA